MSQAEDPQFDRAALRQTRVLPELTRSTNCWTNPLSASGHGHRAAKKTRRLKLGSFYSKRPRFSPSSSSCFHDERIGRQVKRSLDSRRPVRFHS